MCSKSTNESRITHIKSMCNTKQKHMLLCQLCFCQFNFPLYRLISCNVFYRACPTMAGLEIKLIGSLIDACFGPVTQVVGMLIKILCNLSS